MESLSRRDLALIALCLVLAALAIGIVVRYFDAAFPEASIDFRYDRESSRGIAERVLARQKLSTTDHRHAVVFESDDRARIFLERSLGLEKANAAMRRDVRVWYWHHRWFRPEVEEELSVDVAPTGEIVAFNHKIPEDRALPEGTIEIAKSFLAGTGVPMRDLQLVAQSERRLPKRVQRIFTWEAKSIRLAGAPYRHEVRIDGNVVSGYTQQLKVPDAWLRGYRDLRSKNQAAGAIDLIFNVLTMIAALFVFVLRLRRGDLNLRFLGGIGLVSMILVTGVALNQLPSSFAYYDTTESYAAFVTRQAIFSIVQSVGTAMLLIVICGAGEVLYRERLPQHLAIPRLWTRRSLSSKRVFLSLILGYALVPLFMAYQVIFYVTAQRFGAWSPAEVPYDDMLNTALPWVAVLFAGFFPALSEEFLSRAFSIPFLHRLMRSRIAAIVLAGFIWGFGHAMYPNQPFWIRGVEVGIVGVAAGLLMDRFGLLPLLIWHYTIDAIYTAALLFRSGNTYYVFSAALASLIFAVPLVVAIAMAIRNRGFVPDEDLTNASLPLTPPAPHPEPRAAAVELPPPVALTRNRILACIAAVVAAAALILLRPPAVDDAIDYRITADQAKQIAQAHLARTTRVSSRAPAPPGPLPSEEVSRAATPPGPLPPGEGSRTAAGEGPVKPESQRIIATPVEGFRYWDEQSSREDGGSPGGYDDVAASYLVRSGMTVQDLVGVFRTKIEGATYMTRFFTPGTKEEVFVEVDPRTSRVVGYHKYQDEAAPGPHLGRDRALAIARSAFATYGLDANAFELKEPLAFPQPNRLDWLFHFQERTPLAASAYRRVTVRVAGDEVTQFNKTVRIPESVRREASEQTLVNVILSALKLVGMIAILGLAIAGVVMATRGHGLPWRRAAKWTAVLSLIPMLNFAARYESTLFRYSTAISWETFRISLITEFVRDVGLQAGLLFVAIAGVESLMPHAAAVFSRAGRARFGRPAAVAALTTIAVLVIVTSGVRFLENAFPSIAPVETLRAPLEVATPFPAVTESLQALLGAVVVSGAVALYAHAARQRMAVVTIVAIFCASLDSGAALREVPLMVTGAAIVALVAWLIGRHILGENLLAWPLTIFAAATLNTAAVLLRSSRTDLLVNGMVMIAVVVAAFVFFAKESDAGIA